MKVSIITVNYNNAAGLLKTIESVIHQDYTDYEFIIIDGGSTDGSVEIIKAHESHISYWVSEPDNGIYHAMNKGVSHAHGSYLNFMNSGDCFYNNHVLQDISSHLNKDIIEGTVYNERTQRFSYKSVKEPTMMFFYHAGLGHQACFIRRELLLETPYDEHLRLASDWKFFVQKIIFDNCSYHFENIPIVLFEGNGASTKNIQLYEQEREQELKRMFPPRLLTDFERYYDKESPIIDLIPSFNKTRTLHKIIIYVTKTVIAIHSFFKR
jgi:glycosyltransferase involved in cell wall biosynthesis